MITVVVLITFVIINIELQNLHGAFEWPSFQSFLAESLDGKKAISSPKGMSVLGHQVPLISHVDGYIDI